MTFWQAVGFGVLQGLTEFLPVSSSGHLVVLRTLWNLTGIPILFDILLHVATLAVVCIVFRKQIWSILRALGLLAVRKAGDEEKPYIRLALLIVIATVATGILGFAIESLDMVERPKLVASLFIVTAAILIVSRYYKPGRDAQGSRITTGIICGISQGLGVFPGISRSGITISTALMCGLEREKAGEFSFLLSIPAILGALVLKLKDSGELMSAIDTSALIGGIIASFIVGLGALLLLLRIVKSGKLHLFAFYLIPLGILGLIFF